MRWLCEIQSLVEIAKLYSARTLWLDFDLFLNEPEPWLDRVCKHFGSTELDSAGVLKENIMQRYAKRPEARYDYQLRAGLLAQAERKFAGEIASGLSWLSRCATQSAETRALLSYLTSVRGATFDRFWDPLAGASS